MKKLLLSMILILCSICNYADEAPSTACYYVGLNGNVYLKLTFNTYPGNSLQFSVGNLHDIDVVPATNYWGSNYGIVRDSDNVHWDYVINTGHVPGDFDFNISGCAKIYYYPIGALIVEDQNGNLGAPYLQLCSCSQLTPTFSEGCYTSNDGSINIRLVMNGVEAILDSVTEVYHHSPFHFWTTTNQTMHFGVSELDADSIHYDYHLLGTPSVNDYDNGCLKIYYSTDASQVGQTNGIPFITVCPCCSLTTPTSNISISTTSPMAINYISMPGTWDFGDGSPTVMGDSGTHTYATSGTYTVCLSGDNAEYGSCTSCIPVCITNDANVSHTAGNCGGYPFTLPSSDFSVVYGGYNGTYTIVPNSPLSGFVSFGQYAEVPIYTVTYGSAVSYTNSITLFGTGTATFCLEIDLLDVQNSYQYLCTVSKTCMDVCLPDHGLKPVGGSSIPSAQSESLEIAPNPATDNAVLSFSLNKAMNVKITITDIVGKVVSNVADRQMNSGEQKIEISTANLAAGVYNVSLQTGNGINTQKLSVVK